MKEAGNSLDIFHLVKGLSSSEKSYYSKMAKRHSDQNTSLHLKLFKLLDESEEPDEDELCKALGIENKIHFSGLKTYLYKDILNTIVFKEKNNSIDTQLYFLQDQIRMLREKGLVFLAHKLCRKAINLADKYEKYQTLILLLHLQNRVLEYKDYKQFKDTTDSIFSLLEETIAAQIAFAENKFIYEKVRNITSRSWLPITSEELVEIKNAKLLLEKVKPGKIHRPLINLFYLNTLALCQYMLHENNHCGDTCEKIYELWTSNSHLISENAPLFINSFNTNCYNNFIFKNIDHAKENLKAYLHLEKTHIKSEYYTKQFEIIQFNTELKIYLKTARYDQVKIMLDNKSKEIFSYLFSILSPVEQLSVLSSICISYFIMEQWQDSEALLLHIKEQNRQINREDILHFSLLFHLLILYEEKEMQRFESALQAAYQFLYARKKLRPFERQLMLFLKRLSAAISKKNARELIPQFLKQLDKYRGNSHTNLYFLYFNYYGWLESKLLEISYKDYVSQKLNDAPAFLNEGKKSVITVKISRKM
ncbi:MAG: hypothetical protein ABI366_03185 [Ginsengibacter sp.]